MNAFRKKQLKILFTAPRFHTNQIPIVKGLINKGHHVQYFVAYKGATEEYNFCKPIVLKMSRSMRLEVNNFRKKNIGSAVESYISSKFQPDMKYLERVFVAYNPDIVICRENTRLTLCVNSLCVKYDIPCIMYDQDSYYDLPSAEIDNTIKLKFTPSIFKRVINKIKSYLDADKRLIIRLQKTTGFPTVRMTPVLASKFISDLSDASVCSNTYFVPFVGEVCEQAENRSYMENGCLNILCIGKYREYKNLPLFIKALSLATEKNKIRATVLGQVSTDDEKNYFNDLQRLVDELGLKDVVKLTKNVKHSAMSEIYLKHDLLVLPTKRECASISVLEAMSHGLAVISTNYNGTATYIHPPICGDVFETENAEDLACKINSFLHERNISDYGKAAYENMKNKYSFDNYYEAFCNMLSQEYGI